MMIDITTLVFYLFSAILLLSATCVISVKNPVHAALFLVLSFFSAACLWMLLKAEFLAIVLVLVYVGAVMVLFLFVVMMLDINVEELRKEFKRHLPIALLVGAAVLIELGLVVLRAFSAQSAADTATKAVAQAGNNTKTLGLELFGKYIYAVELAGVLLLIAIVAAIALTLRPRRATKFQNATAQAMVKSTDRVRVLKVASETPTAAFTPPPPAAEPVVVVPAVTAAPAPAPTIAPPAVAVPVSTEVKK